MRSITGLTDQAAQVSYILLEDGSRAQLSLYYRPQMMGWFYDLNWPGSQELPVPFAISGRRLVAGPNILRQFKKLIPFGLMVFTIDNLEPMGLSAFTDGTCDVILLNREEVLEIEELAGFV